MSMPSSGVPSISATGGTQVALWMNVVGAVLSGLMSDASFAALLGPAAPWAVPALFAANAILHAVTGNAPVVPVVGGNTPAPGK